MRLVRLLDWKRYGFYLIRWQLSTLILALVLLWLSQMNEWSATVIANLIGGLVFFWVDRFIFTSRKLVTRWEVREIAECVDCHKIVRGYRVVQMGMYNREDDPQPEFRCEACSKRKAEELRKKWEKTYEGSSVANDSGAG